MSFSNNFKIGNRKIGINNSVYFIADIGANHDGNLDRAKKLIKLCSQNGANAVKFQHFSADTIVSDYGFKNLKKKTISSIPLEKKCLRNIPRCFYKFKMD